MTPLTTFSGFLQVAYVTTDLDQAIAHFAEHHGVSRWTPLHDLSIEIRAGEQARLNVALAFVGPTQLELIQPIGGADAIYREPLPAQGFALKFHHVAQLLDTEEAFELRREELRAQGHVFRVDGQSPGATRYFYTDYRDTLGHYVETCWYTPAGRGFMAQIARN